MVRASVIGAGRIGFDFGLEPGRVQPASHFHCYKQSGFELAVCDTDNNKLEAVAKDGVHVHLFHQVADMLRIFKPNIVSICTPTETHKEITKEVAECESVKAIMLEKPISNSLSEADEIINCCKQKQIVLSVNHTRRWDLMYTRLEPYFGTFHSIVGHHPGPLIRTGIHMLDLFNMLMTKKNPPVSVQAFGSPKDNYLTKGQTVNNDYNTNGCVTYKNGAECFLYSGKHIPGLVLFEVDMFTDTSRIRVTENGYKQEEYLLDKSIHYSGLHELQPTKSLYRRGWYKTTPLKNALTELYLCGLNKVRVLQDFSLSTSGETLSIACSGEDARVALNVALALHYSSMNNNFLVRLEEVPADYTVRSY